MLTRVESMAFLAMRMTVVALHEVIPETQTRSTHIFVERLTDALQAGDTRDQSLTGHHTMRKNGDKKQLRKEKVAKADVTSKILISDGKLPEDLLARILWHLPSKDLLRCAAVCRRWQQIVRELTGNAFTFKLNLQCPICHAEVSDNHKSNLQRSSEWQMTSQHTPPANLSVCAEYVAPHTFGPKYAYAHCSDTDENSYSNSHGQASPAG